MSERRLKTWRELLATPLGAAVSDTPNLYPAVLWPSHKHDLDFTPDEAVWIVQRMVGTLEDEPYEEPTQDQIDEWMIGMTVDGGEA